MARIDFIKDLICNTIAQTMGTDYYPASGTESNKSLAAVVTWMMTDVGKDVDEAGK